MARRDVPVVAGEKTYTVRFSCAAARLLDPEGALGLRGVVEGLRKPDFLVKALAAGLEGARLKAGAPESAKPDAEAVVDEAGVQQTADAVTEAYLAWFDPSAPWPPKPPGAADPNA